MARRFVLEIDPDHPVTVGELVKGLARVSANINTGRASLEWGTVLGEGNKAIGSYRWEDTRLPHGSKQASTRWGRLHEVVQAMATMANHDDNHERFRAAEDVLHYMAQLEEGKLR